jgi:hypothetical protein
VQTTAERLGSLGAEPLADLERSRLEFVTPAVEQLDDRVEVHR